MLDKSHKKLIFYSSKLLYKNIKIKGKNMKYDITKFHIIKNK